MSSLNVLVADDNAIMRAVVCKHLRALGFDERRIDYAEGNRIDRPTDRGAACLHA